MYPKSPFQLLPLCLFVAGLTACSFFAPPAPRSITTESGEKINLNDAKVQEYIAEWHEAKPSIERLAELEGDLNFLLAEVSRMSDLGRTPGLTAEATSTNATESQSGFVQNQPVSSGVDGSYTLPAQLEPKAVFCPESVSNNYQKSLALASFPRMQPTNSNPGALHQVELHLPMLLSAHLNTRHSMPKPLQLQQGFSSADQRGEMAAAAQAQQLAQKNRVQFIVSGQVEDMSMKFPKTLSSPSHYTRFVNGVHNLLHINTPLDKRSRIFTFTLEVRDGITGQRIYNNQYSTFGHWKPSPGETVGFASARFWQTDYGQQIQQLVAKASDDLAQVIDCQPYMARVDARPGQNMIVIHSGSNNGLRPGDALELYQLVQQPVTGGYQQYDTRLIKQEARVYLIETYPSHSVAHVADDLLMNGQYLVKAP